MASMQVAERTILRKSGLMPYVTCRKFSSLVVAFLLVHRLPTLR
jgi:hypothetical protein